MRLEEDLEGCTKIQAWNKGYAEASRILSRSDLLVEKRSPDTTAFEAGYRQGWRDRDNPSAPIPRYSDLTRVDNCNISEGDLLTRVCACGHLASRHKHIEPTTTIVCMECKTTEEPSKEVGRRLDGMVDVILRMEQRLVELIKSDAYQHGVSVLESVTGPTDHELWRDSLMLAVTDKGHANLGDDALHKYAKFFWNLLQEVPARKDQA
jgi:hypothetical protein